MPPKQPSQLKPVGNTSSAEATASMQKPGAEKTSVPGLDTFKSFFTGSAANSDKTLKVNAIASNKNATNQAILQTTSNGLLASMLTVLGQKSADNKKSTNPVTEALTPRGFIGNLLFNKKEEKVEEPVETIEQIDVGLQNTANDTIIASLPSISSDIIKLTTDTGIIRDLLYGVLGIQQKTADAIEEANTLAELANAIGTETGVIPPAEIKLVSSDKSSEEKGGGLFSGILSTIKTIGPLIGTIGAALASSFSFLLTTVLPVVAVLGLLALAGYLIYENWETIAKQVSGLWDKTFGLFTGMFEKFMSGNILGGLFDWFVAMPMMFNSWILLGLKGIFNFLASIPLKLVDWIGSFLGFDMSGYVSDFKEGLNVINKGFDFVIDLFSNISAYAAPVIDVINSVFVLLGGLFMDAILNPILYVWEILKGVFATLTAAIDIGISTVMGYIDAVWGTIQIAFNAISNIFSTLYDFVTGEISFTEMMSTVWDIITSIPMKIWDLISGIFDSVISSIGSIVSGWFKSIKSMLTTILDLILAPFKRIAKFFGFGIVEKPEEKTIDKKSVIPAPLTIAKPETIPEIKPGQSLSQQAAAPLRKELETKEQLNNANDTMGLQASIAQTNQTNISNNANTYQTQVASANNSRLAIRGV